MSVSGPINPIIYNITSFIDIVEVFFFSINSTSYMIWLFSSWYIECWIILQTLTILAEMTTLAAARRATIYSEPNQEIKKQHQSGKCGNKTKRCCCIRAWLNSLQNSFTRQNTSNFRLDFASYPSIDFFNNFLN